MEIAGHFQRVYLHADFCFDGQVLLRKDRDVLFLEGHETFSK